jgi:site-specific DNA recombinase
VSVTQAFNTTTSMGRLTLNVLLSFAQFEREVTGERIRDKIAASKARGMWIGGGVPLGYEVKDCKLVIVPEEAERVRHIFGRYLALGSVYALLVELAEHGIRTKARTLKDGSAYSDKNFSRGALYQMLASRIYLGEITHRGKSYPGEHDGIIDPVSFEQVEALLGNNRVRHINAADAKHPGLLAGILWDGERRRMSPNHANKDGARYRYYNSLKDKERLSLPIHRVPAGDIENIITHQVRQPTDATWDSPSASREVILQYVEKITVYPARIVIQFADLDEPITVNASLIRCSGETRIATASENWPTARRDHSLIKLIVRAHQAKNALADPVITSIEAAAAHMGHSTQYFCALLRLGYLAPDITVAILEGRHPTHLNRQFLARINNLPIDWAGQREMLGFA